MGIKAKIDAGGKDFEVIEDLIQGAVLADVTDKGMVDNSFKPGTKVHKCGFVWLVAEEDTEGRSKRVFETFTVSMHEKASLRKRYKELTGKKDADLEAMQTAHEDADLDALIGTKRMLVLSREDGENGKPYLKVTATMPLKKGMSAPDIPKGFVRKQDKTEK